MEKLNIIGMLSMTTMGCLKHYIFSLTTSMIVSTIQFIEVVGIPIQAPIAFL